MINRFSSYCSDPADIGAEYLSTAADRIEGQYPEASHDAKCQAAASLAVAMALSQLATAVSGSIEGSPLSELLRLSVEREERRNH